jgi:hypothetical protein
MPFGFSAGLKTQELGLMALKSLQMLHLESGLVQPEPYEPALKSDRTVADQLLR